jgi:hypothetical protein
MTSADRDGRAPVSDAVERALARAAEADEALVSIAARMSSTGFVGIARSVLGAQQRIRAIVASLNGVASALREAAVTAERSQTERTPHGVVAVLTAAAVRVGTVCSQVVAAVGATDGASNAVADALRGGKPEPMLAMVGAIRAELLEAARRARSLEQDIEGRIAHARQAGEASDPTDGPPPRGDVPTTPAPIGQRWLRVDDVPPWVRSAARGFLTRPEGISRPTVSVFEGEQIVSGGRDRSIAADLDHDPLRGPPVTLYQHAEAKAAALNPRDKDQDWACERILPSILPALSRLTVWVTRDGGVSWWRGVYHGTGGRIRRGDGDA